MTIKRSKTFARQWLNASATVEAEIKSNETQKYLKELLKASVNYPDLMKDWTTNISRYISNFTDISKEWGIFNSTVLRHLNTSRERLHSAVRLLLLDSSGSNRVLRELAVIDNAARAWLRILKPIKLDIFYGFPNETALNRYVWNATKYLDPKRHVLSGKLFCCFAAFSLCLWLLQHLIT